MAVTKVVLLAIVVATLPFAENAPSDNNRNAKEDELRTRLVFSDNDNDNSLNSNSRVMAADTPPVSTQQKNSPSQPEQQSRPVFAPNNPPLLIKSPQTIKSTVLTRMDDDNQNWGLFVKNTNLPEDESYFNRPLLLPKVINTKVIETRKSTIVTKKSSEPSKIESRPSACDTAVIACCANISEVMQCFKLRGCSNATEDSFPYLCSASYLNATINRVAAFYKGSLANGNS